MLVAESCVGGYRCPTECAILIDINTGLFLGAADRFVEAIHAVHGIAIDIHAAV